MHFNVITIFPEMFSALTQYGITRRAFAENLISAKFWQLRDFADNNYKSVDDSPYGGGAGMVLTPEPLAKCLNTINATSPTKIKTIYITAGGEKLTQKKVIKFSQLSELTIICGRYEGIDQRIIDKYVDEEINVGDFVVSGGELPAMMLLDAIIRQIPNVIPVGSLAEESFSLFDKNQNQLIEYPQYTRPEEFLGMKVPEILMSGDHQKIAKWRANMAYNNTLKFRPELITKKMKTENSNSTNKKVYIRSFGCQMNEYDSQKLAEVLFDKLQYQQTEEIEKADLILLNTCSVREKAESKVYDDLGRIRFYKQNNPNVLIGVGGCVASQTGKGILKRAPYVDLVFGPQTIHRLPQMISNRMESGKAQVDISFPAIEKFDNLPQSKTNGVSAFVSIMEGCSKFCSFCIVPYTRGTEVSRPLQAIINECLSLSASGAREIILLGQNVNGWNMRGRMVEKVEDKKLNFADLLNEVHKIAGIERIRYLTSHPMDFNNELILAHKNLNKLATHIHLPVQSGSDRILQAMRRRYTALEYLSIIRRLRENNPELSISSDFIVGFPGETEDDFNKTIELITKADIDQSFSFIYSKRPGTPAAELYDDVSNEIKLSRLKILQELLNKQEQKFSEKMVGSVQKILVEDFSKKTPAELMGRTNNYRVVNFEANKNLIGKIVKVKITDIRNHTLRGELN